MRHLAKSISFSNLRYGRVGGVGVVKRVFIKELHLNTAA